MWKTHPLWGSQAYHKEPPASPGTQGREEALGNGFLLWTEQVMGYIS